MLDSKQSEEAKKMAFRTLKDLVGVLYPDSPDRKEDFVTLSKSLRKILRAFEVVLESPDFDNLNLKNNLDDILEKLEEAEAGTKEFEQALEGLGNLFGNSIAQLAESENERTRKAIDTLKNDFADFSISFSRIFDRLFRALEEPGDLEEIRPRFLALEKTEDDG